MIVQDYGRFGAFGQDVYGPPDSAYTPEASGGGFDWTKAFTSIISTTGTVLSSTLGRGATPSTTYAGGRPPGGTTTLPGIGAISTTTILLLGGAAVLGFVLLRKK